MTPIGAILLAASVGGTGGAYRSEVRLGLDGSLAPDGARAGAATATATAYVGAAVVDDATPPALQAYLQRASTLSLAVAAGDGPTGGVAAAVDAYVTRNLAVAADAQMHIGTNVQGDGGAGLGLRLGDARLDLGYRRDGNDDLARLALTSVLLEHIRIVAALEAGGATRGALDVDYFPSRRLGLLSHADASRDAMDVRFGMQWWFGGRWAIEASLGGEQRRQGLPNLTGGVALTARL